MATENKEAHDAQKGNGAAQQKDLDAMLRNNDSSATEQTSQKRYTGSEIVDLYRSGLRGFKGINASNADLKGADLSGAKLTKADLSGANLESADLRGAYLSHADLSGAYLSGANLTGAHLAGAHLEGAKLGCAHLRGAIVSIGDGVREIW